MIENRRGGGGKIPHSLKPYIYHVGPPGGGGGSRVWSNGLLIE